MPSDWESFFRKAEQDRLARIRAEEEANRKRREAEEQKEREAERQRQLERQLAEQRRKASIQKAINQFDQGVKSVLRGYAAAKMQGATRVLSPDTDSSYPTWRLECSGYVGVSVTLNLRSTPSGELEPEGFSISGTTGGGTHARPSISDLANALALSVPKVYMPPSCSCDTYRSCSCDYHCSCDSQGGLSYSVCP